MLQEAVRNTADSSARSFKEAPPSMQEEGGAGAPRRQVRSRWSRAMNHAIQHAKHNELKAETFKGAPAVIRSMVHGVIRASKEEVGPCGRPLTAPVNGAAS